MASHSGCRFGVRTLQSRSALLQACLVSSFSLHQLVRGALCVPAAAMQRLPGCMDSPTKPFHPFLATLPVYSWTGLVRASWKMTGTPPPEVRRCSGGPAALMWRWR